MVEQVMIQLHILKKTLSVEVDFRNNEAKTSTETDTLVSIENVLGGSGKDTFKMNEDNATNIIDGNGDTDTINYEYYTNGVNVNLSTTAAQTVTTGDSDTILDIENITTTAQNDTIKGSSLDNTIIANAGNDTFIAGTDTNNDGTLDSWSDDGSDYYNGGLGTGDWADYSVIADDANNTTNGISLTLDGANDAIVTVRGQAGN